MVAQVGDCRGVQGDAERNKHRVFGSSEILNPEPPPPIAAGLAQPRPDVMSYFTWLGEQYGSGPLRATLDLLEQVRDTHFGFGFDFVGLVRI